MLPTRTFGQAELGARTEMRTSVSSASSSPPPSAKPLIAAITGLCVASDLKLAGFAMPYIRRPGCPRAVSSFQVGAGAERALLAPVRTATRMASLLEISANASSS
jgi:hypothetical protein